MKRTRHKPEQIIAKLREADALLGGGRREDGERMARKRRSHRQGTLFKRHGRGAWVAQWHDHAGKRMFRSTGTTDRAAAERILT